MMKKFLILGLFLFGSSSAFSQLTIEACYQKAHENYPLIKQYNLINNARDYNVENAAKGYLPQLTLSAKATYQSEVTKIPINIQGVEGLSKDQYGVTLDVNQTLWDGGAIKSRQEDIRTANEVNQRSLDVALYAIRERINQLFFGVLLMETQLKQNDIYIDDLKKNLDKVSSYVQNGLAHQADMDAVKVEQLKAQQNRIRLIHVRDAYKSMLSSFIGEKIGPNVVFVKPELTSGSSSIKRPELDWYDAQIQNYTSRRRVIQAGLMPKIGLFLTGGYGRPGLNMLDNTFSAYYMGGIRLSWNISNFYTHKNDKRNIDNQINMVQAQRETFLLNTQMDMEKKEGDIDSYRQQMQYDNEIIRLRGNVRRSSENKIANGMLSGIDLVRDMNAENLAVQDKDMHEIQMLLEIYNLKYVTNN
jgi:outer membrane protein TolC